MSSDTTRKAIYLITGAGRGLGFAISKIYLSRPNITLIAFVRDPSHQPNLDKVEPGTNSNLLKIKYDASDTSSASAAVSTLQNTHLITHLDVVIANAGIISYYGPSLTVEPSYLLKEFTINTVGPITLFQAVHSLLKHSSPDSHRITLPRFFAISSLIGSTGAISRNPQVSCLPYGVSKAALNHAMVKFHVDNSDIIVGIVTPGRTVTEFGRGPNPAHKVGGAVNTASKLSFSTAEQSAEGIVGRVDKATREEDGGKFFNWQESEGEIEW